MKSIGQAAYEAWAERISPPPWSSWDRLPKSARDGWEEIAKVVIDQEKLNGSTD